MRDTEAAARLAAFGEMTDARWIDAVSALTADTVRRCLEEADDNQRMDIANRVLTAIDPEVQIEQRESLDEIYEDDATVRALPGHEGRRRQRPGIPLSQGALITNAKGGAEPCLSA
ncbi:hypothetical protein ACFWIG_06980 [Corynebacterium bovis]|uniref:hypothetical protein n=1 Tax=Corynebacterium bovis TaxID=36808 RepID=UPI000F652A4B|nr:hypothetical protein [Corynebacterium bovis]